MCFTRLSSASALYNGYLATAVAQCWTVRRIRRHISYTANAHVHLVAADRPLVASTAPRVARRGGDGLVGARDPVHEVLRRLCAHAAPRDLRLRDRGTGVVYVAVPHRLLHVVLAAAYVARVDLRLRDNHNIVSGLD